MILWIFKYIRTHIHKYVYTVVYASVTDYMILFNDLFKWQCLQKERKTNITFATKYGINLAHNVLFNHMRHYYITKNNIINTYQHCYG